MSLLRDTQLVILALGILTPSAARAVVVCYDESRYPSVIRLDKTDAGLRALPGIEGDGTQPYPVTRSVVLYTESRGWETGDFSCNGWSDCNGNHERGAFPGPAITLSLADAIKLEPKLARCWESADGYGPCDEIEQNIGAWTEHDGAAWFGISFYDGEGTSGVGGLGRFDLQSKENVVRRPPLLLDISVSQIVHDGQWLWLAAGGNYECAGVPPSHGLMRYNWQQDRTETFEGRDDGPCGFTIHDLLLDEKYLWVATDLGLSRRDRATGAWEHFVPARGASPPMQATTCEAIYTRLLETLPRGEIETSINLHSQLFESLEKFRPRFLAAYVNSMPPEKWGCDELELLGKKAPDYSAFKKAVLDRGPAVDQNLGCALGGFGMKKSRDPEWRDFLLARLESPNLQPGVISLLPPFAPDAKIAEALARRLATADSPCEEAEMLPSMMGDKSVPLLMAALDRPLFQHGPGCMAESIMVGLMRATNTVIWPDGKQTKSPPDSRNFVIFEQYFAYANVNVLEVADEWRAWWAAHKQEYGGRQESEGHSSPPLPPSNN